MSKTKNKHLKVCFFAREKDVNQMKIIEYYLNDIRIFEKLGIEVLLANKINKIPWDVDFYYTWWFGWGFLPLLIAKIRGKLHICCGNIHTIPYNGICEGLSGWPFLKRIAIKFTMKMSDKTILTSKQEFNRLGSFRPKDVNVVYHGIDLKHYYPTQKRRLAYILTITMLSKENTKRKKIIECIEAFSKVASDFPSFNYIIVGKKADATEIIKNHIKKLNLENRILLYGEVSREKKIDLLQKAMIYLQLTSCEGFGLAVVEAMACRTPVITSPEETIREVAENAVLYAQSVEKAAKQMKRLLQSQESWSFYADMAQKKSMEYDIHIRFNRFKIILQELGLL